MRFAVSPAVAKRFVAVWLVRAAVEMTAAVLDVAVLGLALPESVALSRPEAQEFLCTWDSEFSFRQAPADTEGDFGNYRS